MGCMRTYEMLNFDEWFDRFSTVHPQLPYFKDKKQLLKLQTILSQKYEEKIYTKNDIDNIYKNYIEHKRENDIKFYEIKQDLNQKIKDYEDYYKSITDKYIDDLIKEI